MTSLQIQNNEVINSNITKNLEIKVSNEFDNQWFMDASTDIKTLIINLGTQMYRKTYEIITISKA